MRVNGPRNMAYGRALLMQHGSWDEVHRKSVYDPKTGHYAAPPLEGEALKFYVEELNRINELEARDRLVAWTLGVLLVSSCIGLFLLAAWMQ